MPRRRVPINRRLVRYNAAPRLPIPFPTSFTTTLKYSDYKTITQSVAGAATGTVFSLNSMYDPDVSGVGHQPYFYDQLVNNTMYNKATVYGCKVKITATADNPSEILLMPKRTSTLGTNMSLIDERPNGISRMTNNVSRPITLSRYYPINQIFGVAKRKISDDSEFSHDYNANPTTSAYIHLYVMNPNPAFTCTVSYNIELRYYCRLWDRGVVGQS